ncbi:MAG TPA: CotH kinase family protein [Bacteroidia bacterium]
MRALITYILLITGFNTFAQTGTMVFNDTVMHNISIETELVNWFDTLEHDFDQSMSNPDLYPEKYHRCSVTWDGILLSNCGFREKGNASNTLTSFGKKKPFKIAFDEFTNQELDGLEKLNLNNFTNDPSLLHDVICFKLFRDAGIPASRTSFAKLTVNGEYIGIYVVIENVDKTFLKDHYNSANNDGNLYKTDRGAQVSLNWLGYGTQGYEDQGLKLTTNETENDWSELLEFLDHLNNDYSDNFRNYFESNFDIHSYLKILAIEKLVRSWDSYWGGGNNFYMYEHPDGKIRWIPWDMNETFQDIKIISGVSDLLDGYLIPTNKFDKRPLLKRIFEIEDYKNEYLNYACELIQSNFSLDHLGQYILDRHNLIDEAYKSDPYKYNTYQSFDRSLTEYNQDAVSVAASAYVLRINYPGLYPFIQSQREWAVEQMEGWELKCSIEDNSVYDLFVYPNPTDDYINIAPDPASPFDYAQFKLYDFTGKLCLNTKFDLTEGVYTLKLDEVPSGIYLLLKYSADGRIGRAKIIVNSQK